MTKLLRFWRDVEIFNIPDAPTAQKPGRQRNASVPDDAAGEPPPADDGDAPEIQVQADAQAEPRPRSSVVQSFPVADIRGDLVPHPRWVLPWNDSRFHIPKDPDALLTEFGSSRKNEADDLPRMPASYAHAVYLGVGPRQRFVEFILRTHSIAPTEDEQYRPATGQGWLAAFLVNAAGVPLPKSYVAASFAVGSGLLQAQRSLDDARAELQNRSAAFDERMALRRQDHNHTAPGTGSFLLTVDDLLQEWEWVHGLLGGTDPVDQWGPLGPSIVIESVPLYLRKDGSLNPPPEQAATFLNSFYIDDLTALIQAGPAAFSTALTQYLGPESKAEIRLDLLADPSALADHAGAALIPAGRWVAPPNQHLALAQQTAVYQILDQIGRPEENCSRGLMSVNGPPGTGKTTLLKDIIADVVVQRAKRLCALQAPEELFARGLSPASSIQGASTPVVRADIMDGTEIVVTSSNNAAVQNISFELPFSCDRDAFPGASYFPEVAALVGKKFRLQRKHPWGLLAAALGAKPNREKIATALMGYEKAVQNDDPDTHPVPGNISSLKPWLDLARQQLGAGNTDVVLRWHAARKDFQERLDAVEATCTQLALLQESINELPELAAQRSVLQGQVAQLDCDLTALNATESGRQENWAAEAARDQAALQSLMSERTTQQAEHRDLMDRLAEIRDLHDPGWIARGLKKLLGMETRAYRQWRNKVEQARAAVDELADALKAADGERQRITVQITLLAQHARDAAQSHGFAVQAQNIRIAAAKQSIAALDARRAELDARLTSMQSCPAEDRPGLPDAAFIALPAKDQHCRSLWMTGQLEKARAELFLSALRLHEATVMATARSWFKTLRRIRDFLTGQAEPGTLEERAALWRSLFFVVPVVSTTLASFGRLFAGLERESLGWVLVDEAGQATPASVVGAIWRARRVVLVGDPLQIEPVVTVPRKLVEALGGNCGLEHSAVTRWSPSVQSAQALGDRTMQLGARVGEVWTGLPLRTHRRCMSPMFDIANEIAYDNQMVQATKPEKIEPDLFASSWIDVRGEASGKVVDSEIDALRQIMESFLLAWPQVVNDKGERSAASVYVISPFRDVALACQNVVGADTRLGRRFARKDLVVDAGTVHTFQGKEASIVFLVLGSASGEAGAASRRWAASKPNLLNVAVTRAQQRLYVIGNYADWAALPFFCEMAETKKRMVRTQLKRMQGTLQVRLVPAPAVGAELFTD
jgi:predicted  nucleic acid-binding Zn-ribbon protein